jgi:K+-sensing histidine kinase KdpD
VPEETQRSSVENSAAVSCEQAGATDSVMWADMSHELRTPLNGIIGFSQLLERQHFGSLTEQQRAFVEGIQTCGWRLHGILSEMIELAKIDAGRCTLLLEDVALELIIEAAFAGARSSADGKRIVLRQSPASSLPVIHVDSARMSRAFTAVLKRAVHYTPEGGEISLCTEVDQDRVLLCIFCGSAGSGVRATAKPQETPERNAAPEATWPESARPGFTLAGRVIALHGGNLEVAGGSESSPAFRVTIPLHCKSAPQRQGHAT